MASFSEQKASLFSREPTQRPAAAPGTAPPATPPPVQQPRTNAARVISAATVERKTKEARELTEQGMKFMRKGLFTRPDPLAAVGFFEKAAAAYEGAGNVTKAKLMYVQAAETNEQVSAYAAAANSYKKAAKLASSSGGPEGSAEAAALYRKCGDSWAQHGEPDKRGEYYVAAAKELLDVDVDEAVSTLMTAVDVLVPGQGSTRELRSLSPNTPEYLRTALSILIQQRRYDEAQSVAEKQALVCEAMELESSMCKAMVTVTTLQLVRGDAVAADQTFLNSHLNNALYRASKECIVAEELVMSFKTYNPQRLLACQNGRDVVYLERDTIALIKQLSLAGSREGTLMDSVSRDLADLMRPTPAASSSRPKSDLDDLLASIDTDADIQAVEDSETADFTGADPVAPKENDDDEDDEIDFK